MWPVASKTRGNNPSEQQKNEMAWKSAQAKSTLGKYVIYEVSWRALMDTFRRVLRDRSCLAGYLMLFSKILDTQHSVYMFRSSAITRGQMAPKNELLYVKCVNRSIEQGTHSEQQVQFINQWGYLIAAKKNLGQSRVFEHITCTTFISMDNRIIAH
jgi:hypothetical protein